MIIIIILSLIYTVFTRTTFGIYGDYTPLIPSSSPFSFILIAVIAGLALYGSLKTKSTQFSALIAIFYTTLVLLAILVLPHQNSTAINLNMYSLHPDLPGALLIWISIFFIWLRVFYKNKRIYI
jgi:hypothetical protein